MRNGAQWSRYVLLHRDHKLKWTSSGTLTTSGITLGNVPSQRILERRTISELRVAHWFRVVGSRWWSTLELFAEVLDDRRLADVAGWCVYNFCGVVFYLHLAEFLQTGPANDRNNHGNLLRSLS